MNAARTLTPNPNRAPPALQLSSISSSRLRVPTPPRVEEPGIAEIHLGPGELACGGGALILFTLLGSCVAVTLWHPRLKLGGMCHGLVPTRTRPTSAALDGRFTDEAVDYLLSDLARRGARASELEAKVFGGGDMFHGVDKDTADHVGTRNVDAARSRLSHHRVKIVGEDVLGVYYRNVVFEVASGTVWVRRQTMPSRSSSTSGSPS